MSDYRRLISYIYAYDKDVKGHSVGFAKLESRNGQCKISVSVKKLYMGNAEWNVYLLTGEQEIPIGRFYIRGQGGEFRTIVQTENVERSGYSLSAMHGLSIHGDNSESRYYMTIWEEPNVHAAELEVEGELQASEEAKAAKVTVQPALTAYVPDAFQMNGQTDEAVLESDISHKPEPERGAEDTALEVKAAEDVEQQVQDMEELLDGTDCFETGNPEELEISADPQVLMPTETMPETDIQAAVGRAPETVSSTGGSEPEATELHTESDPVDGADSLAKAKELDKTDSSIEPEFVPEPAQVQEPGAGLMGERNQEESNWQVYAQTASRGQLPLWEKLRKRYAKIQAFDYAGGCEILTIKPQDIGLLPRENWVYGNNSFLLHAYYNYRYLILVKLDEPDGTSRYLLGVPGMYYTNEKYMASMFGFPDFILAKKQPHKDGRFGYWYAEVKI